LKRPKKKITTNDPLLLDEKKSSRELGACRPYERAFSGERIGEWTDFKQDGVSNPARSGQVERGPGGKGGCEAGEKKSRISDRQWQEAEVSKVRES